LYYIEIAGVLEIVPLSVILIIGIHSPNRQKSRTHFTPRQYTVTKTPHGRKFLPQTSPRVFKIGGFTVRIGTDAKRTA
jgi:hypothetical protein